MTKGRYLKGFFDDSLYTYQAKILRVIDADTLELDLDLGFDVHVNERIRLSRIDAPEKGTEHGDKATEFVTKLTGRLVQVKTEKDRTDKYGRYLAEVYYLESVDTTKDQWINLNDLLLNKGYAEPYEDG